MTKEKKEKVPLQGNQIGFFFFKLYAWVTLQP